MNFHIRKGEKNDLEEVLKLIQELADFEHASDEVSIDLSILQNDAFGPNKSFDFLVAVDENNRVLGTAIYYFKYSTWKGSCIYLEDLIVGSKYRNNGIGKRLLEHLARYSKEQGVARLEWQVLDWNKDAIRFYDQFGASFDNEWINCRLDSEQLKQF